MTVKIVIKKRKNPADLDPFRRPLCARDGVDTRIYRHRLIIYTVRLLLRQRSLFHWHIFFSAVVPVANKDGQTYWRRIV